MKLLLLADKESPYFWDYYQPGRLREYDLMLSCGGTQTRFFELTIRQKGANDNGEE